MTFVPKKVKEQLQKLFNLPAPKQGFQLYDGTVGTTVQVTEFVDDGKYVTVLDQDELDIHRFDGEGGPDPEETKAVRLRKLRDEILARQEKEGRLVTLDKKKIIRPW